MNVIYPDQCFIRRISAPYFEHRFVLVFISKRLMRFLLAGRDWQWKKLLFPIARPVENQYQDVFICPNPQIIYAVKTDQQIVFT